MKPSRLQQDAELFGAFASLAETLDHGARRGTMFGCPAIYCGNKLAGCVYGGALALKVPEPVADEARRSGRATHFTPYGRPPMREWIEFAAKPSDLAACDDLIAAALAFAAQNCS